MFELGSFAAIDAEEPFAGVLKRSFDAEGATVTEYRFEPGASFPLHRHEQEQITLVEEGRISMRIGSEEHEMGPGTWSVVGASVEHGITAVDAARFLAIVMPRRKVRDEYELSADA